MSIFKKIEHSLHLPKILLLHITTMLHLIAVDHNAMDHNQHHNHSYAPAGIMDDHIHPQGEWMFSYRFMRMDMKGLLDGSSSVSSAEAINPAGNYQYMMTPEKMTMDMHMLGIMYAWSDNLNAMFMLPYSDNSMRTRRRMGTPSTFNATSRGVGDLKLGLLFRLAGNTQHRFHTKISLSIPTGSINKKDDTPMGANTHLAFPMQLGSGTWDLLHSLTYIGQNTGNIHWGAQTLLTIRNRRNANNYRLGNNTTFNTWASYVFANDISVSTRLTYKNWGNIIGDDTAQNPAAKTLMPNADPNSQGGQRIDWGIGIALNESLLHNHHLSFELIVPIEQNLDGPQMKLETITHFLWKYSF